MKLIEFAFFLVFCLSLANGSEFSLYNLSKAPPVDPSIILYISDHLTPQQCYRLINFLTDKAINPSNTRQKFWNFVGNNPENYPCRKALEFWNYESLQFNIESTMVDKTELAESFLLAGLSFISQDLEKWLLKVRKERSHVQNQKLNELFSKHVADGLAEEGKQKKSSKQDQRVNVRTKKISLTEDDEDLKMKPDENYEVKLDAKTKKEKEEIDIIIYIIIGLLIVIIVFVLIFTLVVKFHFRKKNRSTFTTTYDVLPEEDEDSWVL